MFNTHFQCMKVQGCRKQSLFKKTKWAMGKQYQTPADVTGSPVAFDVHQAAGLIRLNVNIKIP